MALSAKVGSLACPSATGNQAITGLGFQPKAIIFFGNGMTADGAGGSNSQDAQMSCYLGVAAGTSGGCMTDNDDFTSGNPQMDTAHCIQQGIGNFNNKAIKIQASLVSLDANGFTLNWTNVTSGFIVNYLALGGTELQASVTSPTVPTGVGSWGITGAGFAPDAAIILLGATGFNLYAGIGLISKTAQAETVAGAFNTGTNALGEYERTNQAIANVSGAVKEFEAALTSFDTDGVTLNVTSRASGATLGCTVLWLKGVQMFAGNGLQKTSTGTQAYTGFGFTPKALLLAGAGKTAGTTIVSNIGVNWMFGATDGTNRGVTYKLSNANGNHTLDRTKLYKILQDNAAGTVLAAADLSTFDTDGFTLNYTTADATAREFLALAFGDPASGSSPQTVSVTGLGSQQAFGAVTPVPGPVSVPISGLASQQAFGTITPVPGPVTVPVSGLVSEQAFGAVTASGSGLVASVPGLASEQAFGAVTIHGSVVVAVAGLASQQAFGAVTPVPGPIAVSVAGLASEQAFGSVHAGGNLNVPVAGLASAQAFGAVTPFVGPVTVPVPGLGSEQAFGSVVVQGGIGPQFTPAQAGRHYHR